MTFSLEFLSTELLFEVFEYLLPFDLFRSFSHLNGRFDGIVRSYSLRLNCRSLSRSNFDFICRHIQPSQVIALSLSDETLPDQVSLFLEHFPNFHREFSSLRSMALIESETTLIHLPISVSSISIRNHEISCGNADFLIDDILRPQKDRLTHLTIDELDILYYEDIHFSVLTHLTIDGGIFFEHDDIVIPSFDRYDTDLLPQSYGSFLTHLHLFIDGKHQESLINLEHLSHCLTHLTLHFAGSKTKVFEQDWCALFVFVGIPVSFESAERCVKKLDHLKRLTIQASGTLDLLDGQRWEQFIVRTALVRFHFKFRYKSFDEDQSSSSSFLESFRSPFWVEQKRWYVGCSPGESDRSIFVYSVPRFLSRTIDYPSDAFPPLTTAPAHLAQHFFDTNQIDSFFLNVNEVILPSLHRFTHVKSLHLSGSSLLPLDLPQSIVHLHHIESVDVSNILRCSPDELDMLIDAACRLSQLKMKFDPLFRIPSQISSLILENSDRLIPIDILSHQISSVRTLQIDVKSKEMIIDIIDRLDHLDSIVLCFDADGTSACQGLTNAWFEQNTRRLRENNFTNRDSTELFSRIYLSIADGSDDASTSD